MAADLNPTRRRGKRVAQLLRRMGRGRSFDECLLRNDQYHPWGRSSAPTLG
jgi:hypothetical protein